MNDKNYYLNVINKSFKELNPIDAGYEKCESMHSFGPSIREYWLIHYVVDGTGKIVKGEKTFTAHRGQAFLIRPDEICTYTADKYDPWEYIWIGFTGSMAEKFNCLEDVFNMRGAVFYEILQAKEYKMCRTEFLASKLLLFPAQILLHFKLFHFFIQLIVCFLQFCMPVFMHFSQYVNHIPHQGLSQNVQNS